MAREVLIGGAGLAQVHEDPVGGRIDQLHGVGLPEVPLHLRQLCPHPVSRQPTGDEDDVAVGARDAPTALRQRLDLEHQLLAAAVSRCSYGRRGRHAPIVAALPFELDSYRRRAENFCEELSREYYLHLAGRKPDFQKFRMRNKRELEDYLEGCALDLNAPPSMRRK